MKADVFRITLKGFLLAKNVKHQSDDRRHVVDSVQSFDHVYNLESLKIRWIRMSFSAEMLKTGHL